MKTEYSAPAIMGSDVWTTSATPQHDLGQKVEFADGRVFRYCQAGASGITAGKLQLAPAPKTNHHNIAVYAAAAVGGVKVTVTLGATAATANEYAEGYMVFSDVAPEGTTYKIKSHPAADASATLELTLFEPLREALTTTTEVCLVHNNYNGVVEGTSSTQQPAGIPLVDIATTYYGWLQTKGICAGLADETINVGAWVTAGTSVAGALEDVDDVTAPITDNLVGFALVAGVDTEYRPIYLWID